MINEFIKELLTIKKASDLIPVFGVACVFLVLFSVFHLGYREYKWSVQRVEIVEGKLLEREYKPSTYQTYPVSTVVDGRTTTRMHTTGESEKYITIWDVESFGTVICQKKDVFTNAKEGYNRIGVKFLYNRCRVMKVIR